MAADERIAVIGGAAAGAAVAIRLARAGRAVSVIESASFPRAKVCGEFVSPAATTILESLIPIDTLLKAGARRVREMTIWHGSKRRDWTMRAPAWALSRRSLDDLLLREAAEAGAAVLQPERVSDVEYADDSVSIRLASGSCIQASLVIHADGRGRFDPAGSTPLAANLVGLKCHARFDEQLGGIHMRSGDDAYIGGIDVEDGLATLAMCVTPDRLKRHGGDRDALLADLWPGFDPMQRVGPWHACGVARSRYIEPGHPRSFRIGNAAAAVDPVGGEGIGLALWSAETLAGMLCSADAANLAATHSRFARAYRHRLATRRHASRAAAELLMRPTLVRLIWPAFAVPKLSIEPWYRLSGKPIARAG